MSMHNTISKLACVGSVLAITNFSSNLVFAQEGNDLFKLSSHNQSAYLLNYDSEAGASKIISLKPEAKVTGFAVNGSIVLNSNDAFVRVILVDTNKNEYLVYEADKLLSSSSTITLNNASEETKLLKDITLSHLRIESDDATVVLDDAVISFDMAVGADSKQVKLLAQQRDDKIARINKNLKKRGIPWVAGKTSVSSLTYAEKKKLFSGIGEGEDELPNLHGFEYYAGGFFTIPSDENEVPSSGVGASPYVSEFTWENRHGKSWVTSVKNQGSTNACWAFSTASAIEIATNLYYNQQLNLNLSEQELGSCSKAGTIASGGYPDKALDYVVRNGLSDDQCYPFVGKDTACKRCDNPNEIISVAGRTNYRDVGGDDELKGLLLKGGVQFALKSWRHAITLVGYKTIKEGDKLHYPSATTVKAGDPLIGKTAWRIKNSWGTNWGDKGFGYVITATSNIYLTYLVNGPVNSIKLNAADIKCADEDKDGYYNWGIGNKPNTCPNGIPAQADGDDANAKYGPMDEYGNFTDLTGNFIVTFTAGPNGRVSGSTSQHIKKGDDTSSVTAIPNAGYHFKGWTGGYTGTDNPLLIRDVASDMSMTAIFEADNALPVYSVQFKAGNNGSIQGATAQQVERGKNATTVTAVANKGYRFKAWAGGYTGTENPLTLRNVTANATITAIFEPDNNADVFHTVKFVAGSGGRLFGFEKQSVKQGRDAWSVWALPNNGYRFKGWVGGHTGAENPLRIRNVTADMTITAVFERNIQR